MNKELNYFSAIKFLSGYILKHKRNFGLLYFCWMMTALLQVYTPITFAVMIDEIIYYRNISVFLNVSMIFACMLICACLIAFFSESQHCHLSIMFTYDIKRDIWNHILYTDAEYMSDVKTGDLINICDNYANECMHFVVRNIIHMLNNTMMLVMLIIYIFRFGWQIGLLMLAVVPISVYTSVFFGKKIRYFGAMRKDNYRDYSGWLYEIISGLRDIRMIGAKETAKDTFIDYQRKNIGINTRTDFYSKTSTNLINLIQLIIRLSIYGVVAWMAFEGNITIGILAAVLAYYTSMTNKVRTISGMYLEAQYRVSYIQHIYDLLNTPTEHEWKGKRELNVTKGNIKFCNIDFGYKNSNTLFSKLNLEIKPEDKIALVGESGQGKTTLAYMLIGFYRPQKGYIEIDGQRLSECTLKSIRESIGIVQQEVLLFDGTIRENLSLGRKHTTMAEMESALKRAGIFDYVASLPNGIDTVIGKSGIGLSGGQKQRLAIARIYLKDPKIIIFDEATSALDKETEEDIHKAWEDVLKGRTTIVIAHRQSSVMLCTYAAILKEGQIVEVGSPAELMETSKVFKTLFAIKENDNV